MHLSPHFTMHEATRSQIATRFGIDNQPPDNLVKSLIHVAVNILEPVRGHFMKPFSPSSFYRSLTLNRMLKSKDTSQHVKGEAVDFEVPGVSNLDLAYWCRDNLDFDQLILEFYNKNNPSGGWVHCSYMENGNRGEVMTVTRNGTFSGLPEV